MNIFLDAFIDTNFGDNVFVHTITQRYPKHHFFMIMKEGYESSYHRLAEHEHNIHLLESSADKSFLKDMDGMVVVGGDLFWNGNYREWLDAIEVIKGTGGFVIFLGMSLFDEYTSRTRFSLRVLFSQADVMVLRESVSGQQAKAIAPRANILSATDMAFTTTVSSILEAPVDGGVLGISIRKKIPRNRPDAYQQYCQGMAKVAEAYLLQDDGHKVRFLALSKGVYDDEVVAREIMQLCPKNLWDRMECVTFSGNVSAYITQIQHCEKMVCTRFHALVFAILLNKVFVPIVYEDKVKRLLDEIGYFGACPRYEDELNEKEILEGLERKNYQQEKMEQYLNKASTFFAPVDAYLDGSDERATTCWKMYPKTLNQIHKLLFKVWNFLKKKQ